MKQALGFFIVLLALGVPTARAESPIAVSPGRADRVSLVESRCPTFGWGRVAGARSYDLVVYRLGEEAEEAEPVLRKRFPGTVDGWTPSLDLCLARGGRYAWSVRAVGRKETSEWSTPSLFEVVAGPSERELEEALAVVREYFAARAAEEPASQGPEAAPALLPELAAASPELGETKGPETETVVLPGPVSIHAVQTEPGISSGVVGETASVVGGRGVWGIGSSSAGANYGVYGESAAALGAGVYGTNTGGGLAGLFDGSLKAQKATGVAGGPVVEGLVQDGVGQAVKGTGAAGEWGFLGGFTAGVYGESDSAGSYGVYGKNTGGGLAGFFEGDVSVVGALSPTSLSCSGCITSTNIGDDEVGSTEIVDSGVRTWHIRNGTILPEDIAPNGIYLDKSTAYQEEVSQDVPLGLTEVVVACRDANDLPIQGSCFTTSQDTELKGARALNWDTGARAAEYRCVYENGAITLAFTQSSIVCAPVN